MTQCWCFVRLAGHVPVSDHRLPDHGDAGWTARLRRMGAHHRRQGYQSTNALCCSHWLVTLGRAVIFV